MAEQEKSGTGNEPVQGTEAPPPQSQPPPGQAPPHPHLIVDDQHMKTSYANAFRANSMAEEVMIDFGLNVVHPGSTPENPEIIFHIDNRIILNYFSAKRLAISLSQVVRRYEEQYGEMQLDIAKRRKSA